MTTIAVRDGIMACDSQEGIRSKGGGARYYSHSEKIYSAFDEDNNLIHLIGMAGDSDGAPLLVEWYNDYYDTDFCDRRILKRMFEFDTEGIVLHADGRLENISTFGVVHHCKEPFYAIGSGTKCALAAMHMGATAAEAVEISKKVDPYTGGKVQVFGFEKRT